MEKTVEELYENIPEGGGKIKFLMQIHETFVDFIKKENPEGAAIYMKAMAEKQKYDLNVVKTFLIVSKGHPNRDIIAERAVLKERFDIDLAAYKESIKK